MMLAELLPGTWQVQIQQPYGGVMAQMSVEILSNNLFRGQLMAPLGVSAVDGQWQADSMSNQLALQGQQASGFEVIPYFAMIQFAQVDHQRLSGVSGAGEQVFWQRVSQPAGFAPVQSPPQVPSETESPPPLPRNIEPTEPSPAKTESPATFDVFLCHSSADKPAVKDIGRRLKENGIKPWLDEWELRPGMPWQEALEKQIEHIKSAAVFVGRDALGPWQQRELRAFLREFVDRNCPVIPVLLPEAPAKPQLPSFLQDMTWVDFRKDNPDPMDQLIWGITGRHKDT
jgi:TIR domain-containing protein